MAKSEEITIEDFRRLAPNQLDALENRGFKRIRKLEVLSPTVASIVYCGQYLAFVFSLDVRDQCVDAAVVKVVNGELFHNWEGGYSSDIFTHLVKQEGYRGKPAGRINNPTMNSSTEKLTNIINGWLDLLRTAGGKLLLDNPNSLP